MPLLDVSDLAVRFGKQPVFHDLSFSVERGTALAIIGPNGAGKTVLFRALIGVIPYEGTVRWEGGTRIGYVPQKLDIERNLPVTGADFLRARSRVAGVSKQEEDRSLEQVGLSRDVIRKLIGTLSGGQFQRLLVACALLGEPDVLLLDEATAGVDEPGQELLYEVIGRLQSDESLTVLLISHELSVVYRYATNVLCLSREKPYCGPPRDLTPEILEDLYGTRLRFHVHNGGREAGGPV